MQRAQGSSGHQQRSMHGLKRGSVPAVCGPDVRRRLLCIDWPFWSQANVLGASIGMTLRRAPLTRLCSMSGSARPGSAYCRCRSWPDQPSRRCGSSSSSSCVNREV